MRFSSIFSPKVATLSLLVCLVASIAVAARLRDEAVELDRAVAPAEQAAAAEQADLVRLRAEMQPHLWASPVPHRIAGVAEATGPGAATRAALDQSDRRPRAEQKLANILVLFASAVHDHGVVLRSFTLGDAATAGGPRLATAVADGRTVDSIFVPIARVPQLRAAKITGQGEYQSLDGLAQFLDDCIRNGAALTELSIEQQRVSFSAYLVGAAK